MQPGEIWFVRLKSTDNPELVQAEVLWHDSNVVEFTSSDGRRYCDARLLEFVGRDYQGEEKRAQEEFMTKMLQVQEPPVVADGPVEEKLTWWKKLWS